MKLLLIDNSVIVKKNNSYFTNNLNALFIKELISCGYKITYFQFASEIDNSISAFDLRSNGIEYNPVKRFNNKLIQYIYAHIIIIPIILKSNFVYFYYPSSFKYATFICKLLGKKFGLYIRGERGIEDSISMKIFKNAFTIFTVSTSFTNNINRILGTDKAITIRPMIPFTDKDIISNRSYIIKQKYSILFLGRIAKDKGIEELLSAISILKKEKYLFELNIVGSGEFIENANKIVEKLKISDFVQFVGPVFETNIIKEYYLNADLFVLPSYHEGFPRTLYEAMIFGVPIITTLVGGIPSLMKDNYNCKSIEPKSIDSTVEGLKFALDNYDKMIMFAKNGTKTVAEVVDASKMTHAQNLHKILQQ